MAAMTLPAAIPATIVRGVGVAGTALAAPRFVGAYFRRLDSRRPGWPLGHVPGLDRATRAKRSAIPATHSNGSAATTERGRISTK